MPLKTSETYRAAAIAILLAPQNGMLHNGSSGSESIADSVWILCSLIAVLFSFHVLARRFKTPLWRGISPVAFSVAYGLAWAFAFSTRSMSNEPFIYFQF